MLKKTVFACTILYAGSANAGNDNNYYLNNNNLEETPQIIDYRLDDKHSFNISADYRADYDHKAENEALFIAKLKFYF